VLTLYFWVQHVEPEKQVLRTNKSINNDEHKQNIFSHHWKWCWWVWYAILTLETRSIVVFNRLDRRWPMIIWIMKTSMRKNRCNIHSILFTEYWQVIVNSSQFVFKVNGSVDFNYSNRSVNTDVDNVVKCSSVFSSSMLICSHEFHDRIIRSILIIRVYLTNKMTLKSTWISRHLIVTHLPVLKLLRDDVHS
jgi:hypothetical protein